MLSLTEYESARVVDDDLTYLTDEWTPTFDEGALRRDSPLLRRLLVDGQYAAAWRTLGLSGEPYVSATSLDAALGDVTREYVEFAFAPPAFDVGLAIGAAVRDGPVQVDMKLPRAAPPSTIILTPGYPDHLGPALLVIPTAPVRRLKRPQNVATLGSADAVSWAIP